MTRYMEKHNPYIFIECETFYEARDLANRLGAVAVEYYRGTCNPSAYQEYYKLFDSLDYTPESHYVVVYRYSPKLLRRNKNTRISEQISLFKEKETNDL